MAKVEVTRFGLETLLILEGYMTEFIAEPEELSGQLLDLSESKLSEDPLSCPICPELEEIGVYDYLQMTVDKNYKILYRYDEQKDVVYIAAFMRCKQSAEKLLLKMALKT